jgi:hypothetical protein
MEEIGPIELGSFPIAIYGALFGATVGGQFLGIATDALVGRRSLWVPLGCSVLLEGIVGARFTLSRVERTLTVGDWGRLSTYYSLAFAMFSLPLALWTAASRSPQAPFGSNSPGPLLGAALGILIAYTLLRWGLLTLFGRRTLA